MVPNVLRSEETVMMGSNATLLPSGEGRPDCTITLKNDTTGIIAVIFVKLMKNTTDRNGEQGFPHEKSMQNQRKRIPSGQKIPPACMGIQHGGVADSQKKYDIKRKGYTKEECFFSLPEATPPWEA